MAAHAHVFPHAPRRSPVPHLKLRCVAGLVFDCFPRWVDHATLCQPARLGGPLNA